MSVDDLFQREAGRSLKEKMDDSKDWNWPGGLRIDGGRKMECSVAEGLRVVLPPEVFKELFALVYATGDEVSFLASVERRGNLFKITKLYLVPQNVGPAHTELDAEEVAKVIEKLISEGKTEEAASIKGWIHSHPRMDVFWSGTDHATCARLTTDYLVSLVVSDGFSARARIDFAQPVRFTVDRVPVLVDMPADEKFLAEKRLEVEKLARPARGISSIGLPLVGQAESQFQFESHCEACGGCHFEGECPMDDEIEARAMAYYESMDDD